MTNPWKKICAIHAYKFSFEDQQQKCYSEPRGLGVRSLLAARLA